MAGKKISMLLQIFLPAIFYKLHRPFLSNLRGICDRGTVGRDRKQRITEQRPPRPGGFGGGPRPGGFGGGPRPGGGSRGGFGGGRGGFGGGQR